MSKVNFYRNTAKIVKNNAPKTPKMAPENMAAQNLVDLGKRESRRNDYGPKSSENETFWSEFLLSVISGIVKLKNRSKLRPKRSSWQPCRTHTGQGSHGIIMI